MLLVVRGRLGAGALAHQVLALSHRTQVITECQSPAQQDATCLTCSAFFAGSSACKLQFEAQAGIAAAELHPRNMRSPSSRLSTQEPYVPI